ncbi:MFS transporter [Kribbella sandramycini]|uniref:MFS family permease n=1 Tax=Kribbella sandramycini TaxID=60450 RepID=A0A7Y4NXP5_9ACTN|nr:MFS transporter [Kribbella sandramycini]MBB6567722.1 MFS family permease [Kribbella sandramycini]NOL39681.1 MFS transporter [Kribbella sandramycini]
MVLAVVLAVVFFSFSLPQSLVNPVLPQLQAELGATQSMITWLMTAYLLAASILTPIVGRLGDRYGKDRLLRFALGVLIVGSLVAATAAGVGQMIVGRVLQGAGAGVLPLAFAIVRDETPPRRVAVAISATAAVSAAGGGVGLVLAGPLVVAFGVRSLFWLPAILTAIVGVAAWIVVPPSPSRQEGSINWFAPLLLAAWLVGLLLPLAQGARWGWASPQVIGLLAVAVVLAAAWVRLENRSASPLIDPRLMRRRPVWTVNAIALLMGVGLFSVFTFLPAFLQASPTAGYGFGASASEAGLLLLPMTVTMFGSGLAAAPLGARIGARGMFAGATLLNVAALTMLAVLHDHRWQVLFAMALLGAAFGTAFATMSTVIVGAVPAQQTGAANGVNTNIRTIGGSLGSALVGGIITAQMSSAGQPSESGYRWGYLAAAAVGVVAVGISLLVPNRVRD